MSRDNSNGADEAGNPQDVAALDGPAELVVLDDGSPRMVMPTENGLGVEWVSFKQWRCNRCGVVTPTREVEADGEIVEPPDCVGCDRQGPFSLDKETEANPSASILEQFTDDPVWTPPSDVDVVEDLGGVWDDVYDHIHTHWDAGDEQEWLYGGITAFAISTWFREEFDFAPHILIMGDYETGKTRLLNTLSGVSYRAVPTASASPAAIYRGIENQNLTLYLSEYHDLDDETQKQVDATIKMGQKRGEVALRADDAPGGYQVRSFSPFTHAAVATQREPRDDITSRCFVIKTKGATRDIPMSISDPDGLRNRLLGARFRFIESEELADAKRNAIDFMTRNGIKNRLGEKVYCLLTMANLADRDIDGFIRSIANQDQEERAGSDSAKFLRALIDCIWEELEDVGEDVEWGELEIGTSGVAEKFNQANERDAPASYMGQIRSKLDIGMKRKADGTYIKDEGLKGKLERLADRKNVEWEPTEGVVKRGRTILEPERKPQAELNRLVIDTIVEYQDDDGVTRRHVIRKCAEEGFDPDRARNHVDKLVEDGTLIEQPSNVYRYDGETTED